MAGLAGPSSTQESTGTPAPSSVPLPRDFDLETYIANYTGHGKIQRLVFLADRCPSVAVDACRQAVDEVKRGTANVSLYRQLCERVDGSLAAGEGSILDAGWVDSIERRSSIRQEKLEAELNSYKANLIKESIRMGHNDLGDHFYERGELTKALRCYVRTRDYCSISKHVVQMCLNVIKVSIEVENYSHVASYVAKAEQVPDMGADAVVVAKLNVAAGLAHLEGKKVKMAARRFLDVTIDLGTNFTSVVAPQDIGIYGGLCALASFEREDLKSKVLENPSFRQSLELVPEIRELIGDFYASRYASCLSSLQALKPRLLLDLYLSSHVEDLYARIRCKALVQFFSPYTSVYMAPMAEAFNTTVAGLEKELVQLIMQGKIQARIDSHNKILYARQANQRNATFQQALEMGGDLVRDTDAALLRINLLRHDLVVRCGHNPPQ